MELIFAISASRGTAILYQYDTDIYNALMSGLILAIRESQLVVKVFFQLY